MCLGCCVVKKGCPKLRAPVFRWVGGRTICPRSSPAFGFVVPHKFFYRGERIRTSELLAPKASALTRLSYTPLRYCITALLHYCITALLCWELLFCVLHTPERNRTSTSRRTMAPKAIAST